jgi:hypothetical protein
MAFAMAAIEHHLPHTVNVGDLPALAGDLHEPEEDGAKLSARRDAKCSE